MAIQISDNIASASRTANLDAKFGPYTSKQAVIDELVSDGSNILAVNGLTVGVIENNNVVEYVFKNVPANPTAANVTVNNLFLKQVAVQEETDPTVPAWAKQETKPSYTASEVGAIPSSEKGVAGGVATLGSDGKVPQSQLPSYVDDVLEYSNQSSFPSTGESGKIYVALDTNKTYRWSGSAYVEISQSLALGETSSTAFAGDRGKAIEGKIPSNASSSNKMVTASDLSGKVDKVSGATENYFAAFDSDGGIQYSGYSKDSFATAAQGEKADNAIPMPTGGSNEYILAKDSNETAGVKWVEKPTNGKSAYQLYYDAEVDAGRTPLSPEAWLASLKANIGAFKFVSYDSSAENAFTTGGIGTTYSGTIDSLVAGTDTTPDVILLMNNTDGTTAPTKTFMIATQETATAGIYEFVYAGDLQSAMPNNVLTEDDIVDNLNSTDETKPLSANQGRILKDLVDKNSVGWVDFSNYTSTDGVYVNYGGNKNASNSSYREYSVNVSYGECYSILCKVSSTNVMSVAFYNGDKFMKNVSIICENTTDEYKNYVVIVPQGATEMIVSALKSGTFTIRKSIVNDYNRDIQNILSSGFENNPTSITEQGYEHGYFINYLEGTVSGTSGNTNRRLETFEVSAGQLFLIDLYSLASASAAVAFYNGTTIGSSTYMPEYSIQGTDSQNHIAVFVPTGAVRMCVSSSSSSSSYIYNVRRSTIGIDLNKYIDLSSLDELAAQVAQVVDSANKGATVYNNLQYDYYETGEPIQPSTTTTGLYIGSNRKLTSTSNSVWRIYTFTPSEQDRWLRIKQYVQTSSLSISGAFLIDNTNVLVAGTTIPETDILIGANSSTPKTIDRSVFVPAGRILCVSHSTYSTNNYCNVYNTVFGSSVINDIHDDIEDLQNSIQETVEDAINNTLGIDAIPSTTNPLAVIKETAGYTSIFRTMGVIGGSMSSGVIYPGSSPEYSQIQYIARLCGSEGHNFGRGGMSARDWPKSDQIEAADEFKANPMQMYIIQLGNNDSAYNSDHPEYVIGEVSQVNGIDGTGTVPNVVNVRSAGTTTAYPNYADTFCGQIGKVLACIRRVSPKAHVFLSTFLGGYGSNQNFAYNQAIRDIYAFLSDSENTPTGDTLKYHLIDYETYGTPYSSYFDSSDTIHKGTVSSSHLMASGYLLWSYEYCTYIDWIIKNNMSNFNDVSAICKKIVYNLDNVTIDSVSVNGVSLSADCLPNYVPYQGTLVLHLTAPTSIDSVKVYKGYGNAGSNITSSTWDSAMQTITISSVEKLITITAKGS